MPFSHNFQTPLSAEQKLRLESKLALKSALVCCILGVAGTLFDRLTGMDSHLPALNVIGAIYFIMSIGRRRDALKAGTSRARKPEPGH